MIATIGAFDGFHRGHQTLLRRAAERARDLNDAWGVITFVREPGNLTGFKDSKSLFTMSEQLVLERYFSIPIVHRLQFTPELTRMLPGEFLDHIAKTFHVRGIVVGEDFRFGRERSGTPQFLLDQGVARGWSVDVMEIYKTETGIPICSSAVRAAVAEGKMTYAEELLGYPFFCMSKVIHGNERGRQLGFPTANLHISDDKVLLRRGVYATAVFCDGAWYIGAANIGYNPTFSDVDRRRFEVNLIDYAGNLYDREIAVFLIEHIRDEIRFETSESLRSQIARDMANVEHIAGLALNQNSQRWHAFAAALQPQPI